MAIDDKIRHEKLHYDIKKEAAKIALSYGKIGQYNYLTGEEILPSNQKQIMEQAKFVYSPFERQTEKQVGAIKSLDLSNKKDELKQI